MDDGTGVAWAVVLVLGAVAAYGFWVVAEAGCQEYDERLVPELAGTNLTGLADVAAVVDRANGEQGPPSVADLYAAGWRARDGAVYFEECAE